MSHVYYKPICEWFCVLFNRHWQANGIVLTPQPDDSKVPKLVCYMALKYAFEYKKVFTLVFTFEDSLNRGIYLSPSKSNMRNSVTLALLTHIRLIKEYMVYLFTLKFLVLFWHNDSIMGSNQQDARRNSHGRLALLFYKRAYNKKVGIIHSIT